MGWVLGGSETCEQRKVGGLTPALGRPLSFVVILSHVLIFCSGVPFNRISRSVADADSATSRFFCDESSIA